jgi:hypothetical protein
MKVTMTMIMIMPCKKNGGVKKIGIMMRTMMILALMILMKMIMKTMTPTRITIKDDDDKVIIMMTTPRALT